MVKSKGGKGKRASYKTTVVRVPEPVLAEVQRIIREFHEMPEEIPSVSEPTYAAKVALSKPSGLHRVDLRFR
jgi:hypothetical protein